VEIVSQVLLWRKSFPATQVYLGRMMDAETLCWLDTPYG